MVSEALPARAAPAKRAVALAEHRCWISPPTLALTTRAVRALGGAAARFEIQADVERSPRLASILDHRVRGRALFPAAGFLEVAAQAGAVVMPTASDVSLRGVAISAPLLLKGGASHSTAIGVVMDFTTGAFIVQSSDVSSPQCTGSFATLPGATDIPSSTSPVSVFDLRASMSDAVCCSVVGATREGQGGYIAHPAVLDASFQLDAAHSTQTRIPAHAEAYVSGKSASVAARVRCSSAVSATRRCLPVHHLDHTRYRAPPQ